MAFIEPNNLDYGVAELTARLYGGLVYSNERINHQTTSTQGNFIPLHNTGIFRRRDLLFPHSSTCAVPIYGVSANDYPTELNRLSRISSDIYMKPEYATTEHNRNLLSGETVSDEAVRLWCVDDNSDRKTLLELTFQFDISHNSHLPIRLNRNVDVSETVSQIALSSCALELRAYDQCEQSNKLFVRRDNGLDVYDSSTQQLSNVYKWPLRYFEQIAHMDEVAVVNTDGMVFYGPIETSEFSRVKSTDKIISVATTDSPVNLLLASKSNIFQADIRAHSTNLETIFDFNKDKWKIVEPIGEYGVNYLKDRERIWHVKSIRADTETYFVTSTQRIYVLDRRMPNVPLFYTNHFNFNGGEYCVTGGPFVHEELEMDVYQYFSLSRILNTNVSNWAIGWNKREAVWTSMGPKCEMESTQFLVDFCRSQAHLPHLSDKVKDCLPEVTRAIHYQHFPASVRPNENRALFFRLMDNGQIWFDSINFAKPRAYSTSEGIEKDPVETEKSVNEIVKFFSTDNQFEHFWEFVDDQVSLKKLVEPYDYPVLMDKLAQSVDTWKPLVNADTSQLELDDIDALLQPTHNYQYEELEKPANTPASSQHTFSKIIINMASKTKRWLDMDAGTETTLDQTKKLDDESNLFSYNDSQNSS